IKTRGKRWRGYQFKTIGRTKSFSIIKIKTSLWGELIDYSCARCSPVERGCPVGLRITRIEIIMDSETIKIVSNASGKNYGSGNFKRILSKQGVRIFINRLSIEKRS